MAYPSSIPISSINQHNSINDNLRKSGTNLTRNPLHKIPSNTNVHHEFKILKPKTTKSRTTTTSIATNASPTPNPLRHQVVQSESTRLTTTSRYTSLEFKTPSRYSMSNSTTSSTPLSSPFVESPGSEKRFTLDDFEFGKILGKGKLGRVYCVKHKESGLVVALKAMNKQELIDLRLEKNFRREIEIQSKLYHPNITRLYTWFHDHVNVYLVLEFSLYGELYHHLKQAKRFDNALASYYIYQVTQALIYLHRKNIIHRDLKPENIMLSLDNVIKLSDFGWSVQQHQDKPHYQSNPTRRITLCGTLDYLPPEMVESKPHDKSVDIWALGILTYEFLVGKPPFEEASKDATHQRISKGDIRFPNYVDHDAVDLIRKLLHKVPEKRLSLKSVLNHRWIMKHKPNWPTKK